MKSIKKIVNIGGKDLVIQVGEFAKQADSSVLVNLGETTVIVTVVMEKPRNPTIRQGGVLPLNVDYRERTYAMGKIPGGFFKREGRPREHEIHVSRMIDRSIRPLFPEWFNNPVQVSAIVLSSDSQNFPDIPAVVGASTALMISPIPFENPIGCVRVGRIKDKFIVNPTYSDALLSCMEILVAGTENDIVMIELQSNEIEESLVVESCKVANESIKKIIKMQLELAEEIKKEKLLFNFDRTKLDEVNDIVNRVVGARYMELIGISDKKKREEKNEEIFNSILESKELIDPQTNQIKLSETELKDIYELHLKKYLRKYILENRKRPDNRLPDEIRHIECAVGVLPRTHGAAMFRRGQTQSLVTTTLGTPSDMQVMEELIGEYKERFIFHYNFPGFATGDIKPDKSPSRREIGHGLLAKRAIYPVLPDENEFPYTIRVVSDILESNGSSSMASVCGASLSLYDAGVPLKAAVSGIAMGIIKEDSNYVILTDISGLEDHIGDMDFKVAGTEKGITAIQFDIKKLGIDVNIIDDVLSQAKKARLKILYKMNEVLDKPRAHISEHAPKLLVMQIPEVKIGDLIGPGGKNIRKIIEETGTEIDIEENGKIFISAKNINDIYRAKEIINSLVLEPEVGGVYKGKVIKIMDYGAFVEILPGKEGLVHISQLAPYHVKNVRDILKEGDEIEVKLLEIDSQGRLVLSHKAVNKNDK